MKLATGIEGAFFSAIKQFVLAGLPTTRTYKNCHAGFFISFIHGCTLTVFFATSFNALPWVEKMPAFALRRSFRSIPSRRGIDPTRIATSASLNDTYGSCVATTSERRENELKRGGGPPHAAKTHLEAAVERSLGAP